MIDIEDVHMALAKAGIPVVSVFSDGSIQYERDLTNAEQQCVSSILTNLAHDIWEGVRKIRNDLLAACDWTQLPDAPLTSDQVLAWKAYRKQLREVPQEFSTPEDVLWPEPPGEIEWPVF